MDAGSLALGIYDEGYAMQRELFSIESVNDGWRVCNDGMKSQTLPTKLQAIQHAGLLSYARHVMTGVPTGVELEMHTGKAVLVREYG